MKTQATTSSTLIGVEPKPYVTFHPVTLVSPLPRGETLVDPPVSSDVMSYFTRPRRGEVGRLSDRLLYVTECEGSWKNDLYEYFYVKSMLE